MLKFVRGAALGRTKRAGYGIDGGFIGVLVFATVGTLLGGCALWALRRRRFVTAALSGLATGVVAGSAASFLYSTGPGKRALWAELLDELSLRGDEQLLDVGCGRGAVLILAAHRLPQGRAVGADIWRRRDQNGNSRAAAERNALLEGVQQQVEIVEADARDLPFPCDSFDVVVSNLTVHNIPDREGRDQALREMVRVLRSGGRLRLVDPPGAERYVETLRLAGGTDVSVRRLDWRTWYGLPGHHSPLVSASKRSE